MALPLLLVRVANVDSGSTVPVGLVSAPHEGEIVIGRAADAGFRLDDRTVSSQHVSVRATERGFVVRALSERGSTYLDGELLPPGEAREVEAPKIWLQLGRILLNIYPDPKTVRFDTPLAIPDTAVRRRGEAVFRFRTSRHGTDVWCGGKAVALSPSAARVLARLCEEPGEIVTHDQLDYAVDPETYPRSGGTTLPQLITYIRAMLDEALDAGHITEDTLRSLIAASSDLSSAELADPPRRELLRRFIESVRGVGYRILLRPGDVAFLGA